MPLKLKRKGLGNGCSGCTVQELLREDTPRPRSERSYPTSKVRSSDCALLEQPCESHYRVLPTPTLPAHQPGENKEYPEHKSCRSWWNRWKQWRIPTKTAFRMEYQLPYLDRFKSQSIFYGYANSRKKILDCSFVSNLIASPQTEDTFWHA